MTVFNFISKITSLYARARVYSVAILCSLSAAFAFSVATFEENVKAISDAKLDSCLPSIEALGHSGRSDAADALVKAYDLEKRPLVRRYIVDALGLLKTQSARPVFMKALGDSDVQVRQSAVVALST